jgi:hypothetical protein
MAFHRFVYHPDAEEGLMVLKRRGGETFAELKREIRVVQETWQPEDESEPELIVPFESFFLIFTVAKRDKSTLILAAVEAQPEE